MKKERETIEEVAEKVYPINMMYGGDNNAIARSIFIAGAKWQQERSYSEEEVLNFTQTMLMQYKFGNTNIEQMDLLRETFQLFKNK